MENCNLLLGILIISAMLYIIILNNPSKEHYKSSSNGLGFLAGAALNAAAKCTDSRETSVAKATNQKYGKKYDEANGKPCDFDSNCKSGRCRQRVCQSCI
jgi:hypothetical protein